MSTALTVQPEIPLSQLERMAGAIAKSGMFAVKTPEGALTLLLIAQAEGIHPTQAMMDYDIIQGKPALKSAAMLARFQRSGGRVYWMTSTDECVEGKFSHPAGGDLVVKWDTARLKTAGLADKEMHKKFPLQMKRARCISEAVRAIAPQCIPVGMYAVEEARDIPEEADATVVSIQQAVTEAAAAVTNVMALDEVEALIGTMDVNTVPDLVTAFGRAYTRAKEVGDESAKKRFKSVYDNTRSAIESGMNEPSQGTII